MSSGAVTARKWTPQTSQWVGWGSATLLLMGGELKEFSERHANNVAFEGTYAVAMDLQGDDVAGGYWDHSGTIHGWIGAL
jgi:hypothetical protein